MQFIIPFNNHLQQADNNFVIKLIGFKSEKPFSKFIVGLKDNNFAS